MKDLNTLELYKKSNHAFEVAMDFFCYAAIDAFVDNPTDEEYEVITSNCVRAYMKSSDDCDLGKLSDVVSMKYANKEFTLEELNKMSAYQILDMMYCC